MDTSQLLSVLTGVIGKGGPPAIILALFVGLAMLVREVRGGKLSAEEKASLTAQMERIQTQLDALRTKFDALEAELEGAYNTIYVMRTQRDRARIQAERLGYDPALWEPDPPMPGVMTTITPPTANPTVKLSPEALPPLPAEPPGGE